jgi:hypothetical protein
MVSYLQLSPPEYHDGVLRSFFLNSTLPFAYEIKVTVNQRLQHRVSTQKE